MAAVSIPSAVSVARPQRCRHHLAAAPCQSTVPGVRRRCRFLPIASESDLCRASSCSSSPACGPATCTGCPGMRCSCQSAISLKGDCRLTRTSHSRETCASRRATCRRRRTTRGSAQIGPACDRKKLAPPPHAGDCASARRRSERWQHRRGSCDRRRGLGLKPAEIGSQIGPNGGELGYT